MPGNNSRVFVGVGALLLAFSACTQPPTALLHPWIHPGNAIFRASGYQGEQTCLACHARASNEITHTVHWDLASAVRNVRGLPDGSMADFPMRLAPNRAVYNQRGSVKDAVEAGVKAMGVSWRGSWMAMQAPGTSYISVNHGIRRRGLACGHCHFAHGLMDFKALGYAPSEVRALQRPVTDRAESAARHGSGE